MQVGMLIISKKALAINDIMTSMEAIRDENFHHVDMYQIELGEAHKSSAISKDCSSNSMHRYRICIHIYILKSYVYIYTLYTHVTTKSKYASFLGTTIFQPKNVLQIPVPLF